MNKLDGKVAFLSGAARGIGGATAKLMAQAGAKVVVGDVLEDKGRETVKEIIGAGGSALFVKHDVTTEAGWKAAVDATLKQFGKLDILVNNAGMFLGRDFMEATIDEWNKLVAINMTGVYLGTKVCAPALRDAAKDPKTSPHGSAIVNLASVAGLVGSQLDPLYSMTKGGVTLFTKSTALAFGRKGWRIRVNSIHPGVIETDMGAQTFTARATQTGTQRCRGRPQDGAGHAPDRPARRAAGHRQRHLLPGVRRCRLHDRLGHGRRRRPDGAVAARRLKCKDGVRGLRAHAVFICDGTQPTTCVGGLLTLLAFAAFFAGALVFWLLIFWRGAAAAAVLRTAGLAALPGLRGFRRFDRLDRLAGRARRLGRDARRLLQRLAGGAFLDERGGGCRLRSFARLRIAHHLAGGAALPSCWSFRCCPSASTQRPPPSSQSCFPSGSAEPSQRRMPPSYWSSRSWP